jgi:hypothetical protein
MADSPAFDCACAGLEEGSSLDRLEARGTVRIALKEAGLDASHVTREQMVVVIERVLPTELERRGVENCDALCADLCRGLANAEMSEVAAETPDAVFQRLGGST